MAAATDSFVVFEGSLRAVPAGAPYERLHGMTNAYLAFSGKQPARYELMFNTRLDCRKPKALVDAGAGAFGALVEALAACRPQATPAQLSDLGKQVWALCHGFASLADAERMAVGKREAQALLWQAVRAIVEGA